MVMVNGHAHLPQRRSPLRIPCEKGDSSMNLKFLVQFKALGPPWTVSIGQLITKGWDQFEVVVGKRFSSVAPLIEHKSTLTN